MLSKTVFADCDHGQPTQVYTFENVHEFVDAAETSAYRCSNDRWAAGERREAIHGALYGDEQYVPGALDLLAKVDLAIPPTEGMGFVHAPFGGRADIGDWLAGSPTPMRRRKNLVVDRGTVKVLVSFGPSASLGADVLVPRGQAIMALIMKIQQSRPVELYLYDETQMKQTGIPCYFLIGVESRPLSLAHVGFAVSHPGFFRHVGLGAEYQQGAEASSWPQDYRVVGGGYEERRNERMGIEPQDVILSSAVDWNPLIRRPVEWIKAELERIGIA